MEYIVVKPFVSKGKAFKVGDKIHPLECKNIRLKIGQRKLVAFDLDNPHTHDRLLNHFRKANLKIEDYIDIKETVEVESKPKAKAKPKKVKEEVIEVELDL